MLMGKRKYKVGSVPLFRIVLEMKKENVRKKLFSYILNKSDRKKFDEESLTSHSAISI